MEFTKSDMNVSKIYVCVYKRGDTWAEVGRGGVEEVEEAGAAVEFGEEEGGVGLRFGREDPLEARANGAVIGATFSENPATVAAESHGVATCDRGRPSSLRYSF